MQKERERATEKFFESKKYMCYMKIKSKRSNKMSITNDIETTTKMTLEPHPSK